MMICSSRSTCQAQSMLAQKFASWNCHCQAASVLQSIHADRAASNVAVVRLHRVSVRSRKCGRPRVYDTVTPVLAAAEVAAAGIPPPVRRCRGAKPKYVCHTEQEAVAKRSVSRSLPACFAWKLDYTICKEWCVLSIGMLVCVSDFIPPLASSNIASLTIYFVSVGGIGTALRRCRHIISARRSDSGWSRRPRRCARTWLIWRRSCIGCRPMRRWALLCDRCCCPALLGRTYWLA